MTGTFLSNLRNGGALMAVETKGAISWSEFGVDGKKSRETLVNGASGKYPIVLRDAAGATCVSWKDGARLRWQLYLPDGTADGKTAEHAATATTRHAGVVKNGGGFLLVD